jgi:hypothetical protein
MAKTLIGATLILAAVLFASIANADEPSQYAGSVI